MKVGVIGAGVMGCAAAAALARRGAKVQLFERDVIGAATSSSMGPSRIIRLSYADVDYIRLADQSFQAWRAIEDESGEALMIETGGIDIARPDNSSLDRLATALSSEAVPFELWDDRDLKQAYPQFKAEDLRALFQPQTAVLHADRCVTTLAASAVNGGTQVHILTEVQEIHPHSGSVTLRTASADHVFDRVVICAGPGTVGFLEATGLHLPFTVSMEQSVYFATDRGDSFAPGRFPIGIGHFDEHVLTSIFPALDSDGVKMMIENKTAAADPNDFAVDQDAVEQVAKRAHDLLPSLGRSISRVDRARYTILPDEDFLVDRHPEHDEIIICSACSGHGFKFAPVIGEIVAALAEGGETHPRFRFSPERFGRNAQ